MAAGISGACLGGFCLGIGVTETSVLAAGGGAGLACGLRCAAGLPLLWQPSLNVLQKSSPIWSRALATGLSEGPRSLACACGAAIHTIALIAIEPARRVGRRWVVVMLSPASAVFGLVEIRHAISVIEAPQQKRHKQGRHRWPRT
ncbi:MAG: hypothetical protein NTU78_16745 [Alphaproteobacteria bacterium]|nr:hypothetical protein [Alphaproteobacteria bacterium]